MGRWSDVARVVVAFDGSDPGRVALERGIEESRARSVPLHVVTVVDDILFSGVSAIRTDAAQAVLEKAHQLATSVLPSGRVTTRATVGSPVTSILRTCAPDDLLVVGSRGYGRLGRMLLGSTSSSLVIHAPCPVLVCRGTGGRASGPVLVGIDGSEASRLAVEFAADIADRDGAMLKIIVAVGPVADALGTIIGPDESALRTAEALVQDRAAHVREDRPDLAVEPAVVQAHPVDALLSEAEGARLLVVGSRGRGALASILLGSTGRELAQQAACSVLVVRRPAMEVEPAASAASPAS
ncbi:MAG: universal stress protein [Actinomycetes bacterium]